MKQLLLVFVGGGFGSVLRYLIGKQFNTDSFNFAWGTFCVNLIGSFVIGFIFGYILIKNKISNEVFVFLVGGFCGGFTTFSTFANESLSYLRSGQTRLFLLYVLSSIILGLFCVWFGYFVSTKFI
ncbi:fluoride efflux transporter CrcB [Seonamhaeicola marinus]|uniref:Fluoride-specific ion channel FluC n=1 Tax=Seonamhaeicola marinus TaxID=1912246 RepID=A0A5D0JMY0_9FLAO|nr:fluoride efflux transporter CrcB [Seonamhaeicola marinus]TYA97873.1 fluoride efflux transporter CrcB [Seonamhaeicola marinus]